MTYDDGNDNDDLQLQIKAWASVVVTQGLDQSEGLRCGASEEICHANDAATTMILAT